METTTQELLVQGVSLQEVAEEFGTPVYVYDAEKIEAQIDSLKQAFKRVPMKLKYATKALTNISILKLMKQNGVGADCVSVNEVRLALQVGFTPEEIIFTPNCVSFSEVEEAMELGVQLNIDNLPFLEEFGQRYGNSKKCCIRLNPHIVAGGNRNIQVGHVGSKFGISILQFDQVREVVEQYDLNINGLHVHTGSDILEADVFLKGAHIIFEHAKHFPHLEFLDFGSGFKVAYKDGDNTTDIDELGQKMSDAFIAFCESYGKNLEIWFEPGKYLVSESGYFLVHANLIKESPACTFVGVDSGFNHLIRPMMYGSHHDIINISNPGGDFHVYTVVGYICETDTFATDRKLNEVRPGDVLAFKNAGAYGHQMSSNFNSRLRPAEVLIHHGQPKLIRKHENFEDLTRHQILVDL